MVIGGPKVSRRPDGQHVISAHRGQPENREPGRGLAAPEPEEERGKRRPGSMADKVASMRTNRARAARSRPGRVRRSKPSQWVSFEAPSELP